MTDRTLLLADWIAPVEPAGVVLEGHCLVMHESRIEALIPASQAQALHPGARRIELPGHLLIPGLVNLHSHAAMSLLRGAGTDLPLQRWLTECIWPLEARFVSESFVADGTLLACHEMLRAGITTFNDMYFFPEAAAQAALQLGMRAVVGIVVIDFPTAYASGPDDYLAKGLAARDRLRHEPTLAFTLAPHAPYTVSDATLARVAGLAAELQLPVHMHLHETASEVTESLAQYGERPLERLARLGLLGPELIAVHAVHVSPDDLDLMASHGVAVAHCPHSNLKLGSGFAPTAGMLARGIRVGLGTDGSASNDRLDLLAEARCAALLAKGCTGNPQVWGAHETLRAATLAGAQALGLDHRIGSLVPGKEADIVAIDLSDPRLSGLSDPVSRLIHCAGREHVRRVWIAGQSVLEPDVAGTLQPFRNLEQHAPGDVVVKYRLWQNRFSFFGGNPLPRGET